jgi:hypothetical protein
MHAGKWFGEILCNAMSRQWYARGNQQIHNCSYRPNDWDAKASPEAPKMPNHCSLGNKWFVFAGKHFTTMSAATEAVPLPSRRLTLLLGLTIILLGRTATLIFVPATSSGLYGFFSAIRRPGAADPPQRGFTPG